MIHPTVILAESAIVPEDCAIGPYSIIEDEVVLGAGCQLGAHVVIRRGTVLREGTVVHAGAVIGGEPQDFSFDPTIPSGVEIGARTVIREGVTISRSTQEGKRTVIGSDCYLMATSHVGHDCVLGDRVVLANAALLGGHVHVGSFSFIGGGAGIHQFVRIGESVMVGGNAAITLDLPPFTMVADRNRLAGLNLVGLRRRGFSREVIADVKQCFASVYREGSNLRKAAAVALERGEAKSEQGVGFLQFFAEGTRGFPLRGA